LFDCPASQTCLLCQSVAPERYVHLVEVHAKFRFNEIEHSNEYAYVVDKPHLRCLVNTCAGCDCFSTPQRIEMYVTLTVTYTWPASQMLCHGKVGHMKECTLTFLKQVASLPGCQACCLDDSQRSSYVVALLGGCPAASKEACATSRQTTVMY